MSRRVVFGLAFAAGAAVACEQRREWPPPDAFRAVARQAAEGVAGRTLAIHTTLADTLQTQLPWDARQALITGGFQLRDDVAPMQDTAMAMLQFHDVDRNAAGDWLIRGELYARADAASGRSRTDRWTVRCDRAAACEVTARLNEAVTEFEIRN